MAGGARPLDAGGRRVLDLLLAGDFDGAPALREQARGACVVGRCGCGCPPVCLAPNPDASPAAGPRRVFHRGRPPLLHGVRSGFAGATPAGRGGVSGRRSPRLFPPTPSPCPSPPPTSPH